eukprot:scaffold99734_cov84-Phaeocystis_antarctica.AAC.3
MPGRCASSLPPCGFRGASCARPPSGPPLSPRARPACSRTLLPSPSLPPPRAALGPPLSGPRR